MNLYHLNLILVSMSLNGKYLSNRLVVVVMGLFILLVNCLFVLSQSHLLTTLIRTSAY